jgi:uncharacterized glyoxalase superfamily protein PhnB
VLAKKKAAKKRLPRRPKQIPAVPAGFHTVTPYLAIEGASRAVEFYKKAFGAKQLALQATPDGKVIHARLRIGDSIVMMSDVFPGSEAKAPTMVGTSTVTMHIYSKDIDRLWRQAVAAGARVVMPLDNQYWGERYGQLVDPFGHRWSFSKQVKYEQRGEGSQETHRNGQAFPEPEY